MAKLEHETTVIMDKSDVAEILTGTVCGDDGAFEALRVERVEENATGDFVLTLTPGPVQSIKAVKAA